MSKRDALRDRIAGLGPQICPSMLMCDFGHLADELHQSHQCGAQIAHWDVMDGHFVPNLTYGVPLIAAVRKVSPMIFDAHLMIADPEKYLDDFLKSGCDIITIHLEAVPSPRELLREIRKSEALAGLAINPATPVEAALEHASEADLVLTMSVQPGFGGQKFDTRALSKLEQLKTSMPDKLLQVDGGINGETIGDAAAAGAQLLVVGSAFFGATDRKARFDALARQARGVRSPALG